MQRFLIPLLLIGLNGYVISAPQWNVVLIVADDLGYADLGCYGSSDIRTPNLDRLAAEGVRLTNFYSNGPECTPTRTALLTGRYQQRAGGLECAIGLDNVGRYDDAIRLEKAGQLGLPPSHSILPRVFKDRGYRTAMLGKWHLGDGADFHPNQHGFDLFIGPTGGAVDYFHHTEPKGVFLGVPIEGELDFYKNSEPFNRRGEYLTGLISREAVNWIQDLDTDKDPFFLYLPYTAPHAPYQGPDDWSEEALTTDTWNTGSHETYVSMVQALDEGIGEIMTFLDKENLSDRTLVIFISDNGPTGLGDAGILRGKKGQLFEGGIKVPCIVRWPAYIPAGQVCSQTSVTMDLTASLVALLDADPLPGKELDGIDILSHIVRKDADFQRTLFWRKKRGESTWKAARDGPFKYVFLEDKDKKILEEHLFDLSADPGEKNDLAATHAERLSQLKQQLAQWEKEVKAER